MPSRNVFLTEHFDEFIASGIEGGRYGNASEVVREGLRLLEQREKEDRAKIAWLRGAIREGVDELDRGEGIAFDSMDDFAEHLHAIGDEVAADLETEARLVPGAV